MAEQTRRIVLELLARDRAKGELLAFQKGLDTTFRSARRLATGLLAAAGVGGIGYMIKQQMEAIDATAKLSDRLGMGTEALIGLQHGAKLAGIEQESVSRSLEIFNRKLGEMQMGGTASQQALDALGLSYKDLVDKSPDEAIGIVADQINKLRTQSEKAAAVNYLFGKSGQQLLTLFAEGSKGIAAYRLETDKLGLSFSRIDAAQVEAANDALTRMRASFEGLFRQIAIELAPYIEAASSAFTEFATRGEGIGANVTAAFESITLGIGATIEEVERLIIKFGLLTSPLEAARQTTEANRIAMERYAKESGDVGAFRYTQGPLRPPTQPIDPDLFRRIQAEEKARLGLDVISRESAIHEAFDRIRADARQRAEQRAAEIEGRKQQPGIPVLRLQRLTQADIARMSAEEDRMVIARTREAMESVRHQDYLTRMERIESLRIYQRENAETLSEVEEANRLLNDEILSLERSRVDAMKVYQAELRDDMQNTALYSSEKFAEASRSIESSMSGAFQSMITDGATWRDAMGQFFMDVANAFAKMAADMAARAMMNAWIAPLTSGLSGGIGGLFGGGAGASVSPTLATGVHVAHRGGRVGDLTDRRWVDSSIFANAPRFHGLLPGETAVIAQDDEVISRPGAGGLMKETKFDVRIHNEGSEKLEISQVESYMLSDQRIIDVTLHRVQTNLQYRKGMRGS